MTDWTITHKRDTEWWNIVTIPERGDGVVTNYTDGRITVATLPHDVAVDCVRYCIARPDEYTVTES
jgi:hypothetical protein